MRTGSTSASLDPPTFSASCSHELSGLPPQTFPHALSGLESPNYGLKRLYTVSSKKPLSFKLQCWELCLHVTKQ